MLKLLSKLVTPARAAKDAVVDKVVSPSFRDKKKAAEMLIEDSRDTMSYYVMLISATGIITFGLVEGNEAVIIGGMLVAPVLFPVLSLGLAVASFRFVLFFRSFRILLSSMTVILVISSLIAYFFDGTDFINAQVDMRTSFSLASFIIALLAGFAGAYAWVNKSIRENLPGVAIAVALLPPLCVTGIKLAHADIAGVQASFILFLINVLGIFLSSSLVFILFNYRQVSKVVEKTIKQEVGEEV